MTNHQIIFEHKTYNVKQLFTAAQLQERVKTLANEINAQYKKDEPVIVLIVLHGAILFAADLIRGLTMPTGIESIRLQSYHGTSSTGTVNMHGSLPESLTGNHVLIVEDIIDSGRSIHMLVDKIKQVNPKSVRIATLLDKPDAHEFDVNADFIGFKIGKNFVIGYGLDLDGRYRNLPYVGEMIPA